MTEHNAQQTIKVSRRQNPLSWTDGIPHDMEFSMVVIGECARCKGEATIKVYELPTRDKQEYKGMLCEPCYLHMLKSGTTFAELTEDRLNKEKQDYGK